MGWHKWLTVVDSNTYACDIFYAKSQKVTVKMFLLELSN